MQASLAEQSVERYWKSLAVKTAAETAILEERNLIGTKCIRAREAAARSRGMRPAEAEAHPAAAAAAAAAQEAAAAQLTPLESSAPFRPLKT